MNLFVYYLRAIILTYNYSQITNYYKDSVTGTHALMASKGKPEVPLLCDRSSDRRAGGQAGRQTSGRTALRETQMQRLLSRSVHNNNADMARRQRVTTRYNGENTSGCSSRQLLYRL